MIGWNEKLTAFTPLPEPPQGTLAGWSAAANMLFAPGCEPQAFALLSSFAAPLMALYPTKEGGAIVSVHGGRRAGKSTAMTAAGTVWGMPESLNDAGYNLPLIHTGFSNADPHIVEHILTRFLDARGDWSSILLSFSPHPLPPVERVLEFELHVPRSLINTADKSRPSILERRLLDNRGTAGAAYIDQLVSPRMVVWARARLAHLCAGMRDEFRAGDEKRFQMRAIAAAWTAGQIAVEAGILEASPERIARWAMEKALARRRDANG